MPAFSRRAVRSPLANSRLASGYRRFLDRNPFIAFGLPFVVVIVAGSFLLTPATAVRYERYDRKTHMLDRSEALEFAKKNLKQDTVAGTGRAAAASVNDDQQPSLTKEQKDELALLSGGAPAVGSDAWKKANGEVQRTKPKRSRREMLDEYAKLAAGGNRRRSVDEDLARYAQRAEELGEQDWEPIRVKRLPWEPDGTFEDPPKK